MNPITPKTDHNLNSPHSINTPTNMMPKRILEYQTGGYLFTRNVMLHRVLGISNKEKHTLISLEIFLQNLGVHDLI